MDYLRTNRGRKEAPRRLRGSTAQESRSEPLASRAFGVPELSPDAKDLAISMGDPATGFFDIWLLDISRGIRSRFTSEAVRRERLRGMMPQPLWSPDGKAIIFTSNRDGRSDMYRKLSNGTGPETLVYSDERAKNSPSWSPDGRFILFTSTAPGGTRNANDRLSIWVLPMTTDAAGGERKPFRLLPNGMNDAFGHFSPDEPLVLFRSDESQRAEVSVVSFSARKVRPLPDGAFQPRGAQTIAGGGTVKRFSLLRLAMNSWRRKSPSRAILYKSEPSRLFSPLAPASPPASRQAMPCPPMANVFYSRYSLHERMPFRSSWCSIGGGD